MAGGSEAGGGKASAGEPIASTPLVCLHGIGSGSASWLGVAETLAGQALAMQNPDQKPYGEGKK